MPVRRATTRAIAVKQKLVPKASAMQPSVIESRISVMTGAPAIVAGNRLLRCGNEKLGEYSRRANLVKLSGAEVGRERSWRNRRYGKRIGGTAPVGARDYERVMSGRAERNRVWATIKGGKTSTKALGRSSKTSKPAHPRQL